MRAQVAGPAVHGVRQDPAALVAEGSLVARWQRLWSEEPGRAVLFDGTGGAGRWVSAGELAERTAVAADRLRALGLEAGDRVLWSVPTSLAAVVANIGALAAGMVVVPANPAYTERELGHIVADARPAAAVVTAAGRIGAVAGHLRADLVAVDADLRSPVRFGAAGGRRPGGEAGAGQAGGAGQAAGAGQAGGAGSRAGGAGQAAPGPGSAERLALIGYTSGTTGAPKGAMLTHGNLLASAEALRLAWRWEPEDRLVHALPTFHSHGLCVGLYGTLAAGASAVLLPAFDVGDVLDAAVSHRATLFFGVPTMYHRLAGGGRARELAALRLCVSGSAPLDAALHRRLSGDGVVVLERYGLTETLMNTSNPVEGDRRPGSVGACLPGVDAVVDDDGEVLVRGPNVGAGYWERPDATALSRRDGWFRTGDLGACDRDGYLRLLGRAGDLVISGGFNVYPSEVEQVLVEHPDVAEVAVTGTPSEEWGEVVTAWVVPAGGSVDEHGLLQWAAARLAPYKRPRLVRIVDALPRTALGKVRRSELR